MTSSESAILLSTDHELIGRLGGGERGVKIVIGGNGASVCSRSVAFFEVLAESDIREQKKIKKWREIHLLDPLMMDAVPATIFDSVRAISRKHKL